VIDASCGSVWSSGAAQCHKCLLAPLGSVGKRPAVQFSWCSTAGGRRGPCSAKPSAMRSRVSFSPAKGSTPLTRAVDRRVAIVPHVRPPRLIRQRGHLASDRLRADRARDGVVVDIEPADVRGPRLDSAPNGSPRRVWIFALRCRGSRPRISASFPRGRLSARQFRPRGARRRQRAVHRTGAPDALSNRRASQGRSLCAAFRVQGTVG
jgi:hypothetical protein